MRQPHMPIDIDAVIIRPTMPQAFAHRGNPPVLDRLSVSGHLSCNPTHVSLTLVVHRLFTYPNLPNQNSVTRFHLQDLTGKHAKTKTCQILLEGYYNGILKADEHYISVKKDFSNLDEAVRRFKDHEFRDALVNRAYEYVAAEHTYHHRVESLLSAITGNGLSAA